MGSLYADEAIHSCALAAGEIARGNYEAAGLHIKASIAYAEADRAYTKLIKAWSNAPAKCRCPMLVGGGIDHVSGCSRK